MNIEREALKINLFGEPKIIVNSTEISFPYKKAEALLYYLVVKKRETREILGNLLWENTNDDKLIKKNLRNAIYTIKKFISKDIIIKKGNEVIEINPKYLENVDINKFLYVDSSEIINIYVGDFLDKFTIKDSCEFQEWVEFKRQEYRDMFIDKLIKGIENHIERDELIIGKKYCKRLIKLDEFDERAYRLLIDIYERQGSYNKCLDLYKKLEKLLNDELLISPDHLTKKRIENVKNKRIEEKDHMKKYNDLNYLNDLKEDCLGGNGFFYGRDKELKKIIDNFKKFYNEHTTKSVCLMGEMGIGKSKTATECLNIIKNISNQHVLTTQCYKAEEKYLLKCWNDIFNGISKIIKKDQISISKKLINIVSLTFPNFDFNNEYSLNCTEKLDFLKYQTAENAIVELLIQVSKNKKIIIYIDDFQWADELSISLLRSIITRDKNKSILFIINCRENSNRYVEEFLLDMFKYNLIDKIKLERFTEEETIEFTKKVLDTTKLDLQVKKGIYKETEGNVFFLVEILNNIKENKKFHKITPKIQDVLKNRIMPISESGKKILDILSIFFNKTTYEILEDISLTGGLDLVEIIDELIKKNLIVEKGNLEEVYYEFTHQKIREYIYGDMSLSKKRILHNRAGETLEKKLKNNKRDVIMYSQLIYHFERCGKKYKVLKYKIKYLYEYLQFTHEVFPLVYFKGNEKKTFLDRRITNRQIKKSIGEMELLLDEVRDDMKGEDGINLICEYLHMIGRFHIRQGEYEKGKKYIYELINISEENHMERNIIKAYRQLMCYHINTYNTRGMKTTIDKALSIVREFKVPEEEAIWWRLKGLLYIMKGEYEEGEKLLSSAIEVFERSKERYKYISNLAAAYNWIGESKKNVKDYENALKYFNKAIDMNKKYGLTEALCVFNTNAGQVAYEMGDYGGAERYLSNALKYYEKVDTLWLRSLAHTYYGMVLFHKGEYNKCVSSLIYANKYCTKLESPYETGIFYRRMAELKRKIKNRKIKNNVLNNYFVETVYEYEKKAENS
ncbi:AAA family ATPase [Anaeromicrobium sediminis]|nr:AAA family ATPase [Anaeromicrobium sediminis]